MNSLLIVFSFFSTIQLTISKVGKILNLRKKKAFLQTQMYVIISLKCFVSSEHYIHFLSNHQCTVVI